MKKKNLRLFQDVFVVFVAWSAKYFLLCRSYESRPSGRLIAVQSPQAALETIGKVKPFGTQQRQGRRWLGDPIRIIDMYFILDLFGLD